MPKTFPFIQIRFLQKHEASGAKEDHRLDIKRSDGGYLWVYRAPDLDQTETITLKNREEVFERLEILADLLGIDEDPMLSFQVFIPGMPTVLASIKRFQACLGILQRALDATIERWPMRASWAEVQGRLDADNCHDEDSVYSEDEEDEDEDLEEGEVDDESTDSDMPPLESYTPARPCTEPCCPGAPPRVRNRRDDPEEHAPDREIRLTRDGPRVHLRFD